MKISRDLLACLTLFVPPMVGGLVGVVLVSIFPPQSPLDFWPTLSCLSLGLASAGLLAGLLASLWIRKRLPILVACAAAAILFFAGGAFVAGKGGNGTVAIVCILFGLIAVVVFFARSMDLVLGVDDKRHEGRREGE